ncbi:tyrosyl-tRNA synthetase [Nesidiocoris tenuis]|uniref:Tyrosine--tRNA ligase n=2 Tax=Nesidiocoris tenuis TaxID=355587 RepID=A0ABN7B4X4_9HEMI|nr:tyrosyl-tRNA synthetase [Nesidiocoris tenuis]
MSTRVLTCLRSAQLLHRRNFSNRNVMKLKEKGVVLAVFPDTAGPEITDLCNGSSQCVYAGFDPTARSLHVGNLLVLMNLLHWQRGGHQPIALIGGATGRIGDPSGRNKEREEQKAEIVEQNVIALSKLVDRIFENHQNYFWKDKDKLKPVVIVDNWTWYKELNAVDFICGIGRNFRMSDMLSRSSVSSRLASESGLSYTEFSYQIFQSYDWLHLLKTYNCRFQVGGSDQTGNIMSGHELITRTTKKPVYGMTVPLITTEAGDKFGKSANNAVWLDPSMTSPFDFYQFFIRTTDAQVESLLNLLTFLSAGAVKDIAIQHKAQPEKRIAQQRLAEAVTLLTHGEEGLASAKMTTEALYSKDLTAISRLSLKEISDVFKGAPIVRILLEEGVTVKSAAMAAGCFRTESDADRIIAAGGFYVNNRQARNGEEILSQGVHLLPNNISLFRVGKRNYFIIEWLK